MAAVSFAICNPLSQMNHSSFAHSEHPVEVRRSALRNITANRRERVAADEFVLIRRVW
jgi:hypothetical protein